MTSTYLLTGSNEGDRIQWLKDAITQISRECGKIVQQSAIYETAAWGLEDQPAFLNMALHIHTELVPLDLLETINRIEDQLGRQRTVKWGQRTLDIDILFYGNDILNTPKLTIPHPHIERRRFALLPLNEIATNFKHPIGNKPISQLLEECPDELLVKEYGKI